MSRAGRTYRRKRLARVSPQRLAGGRVAEADGTVRDPEYDWEVVPWRAGGNYRYQVKWKCFSEPVIALLALNNFQLTILPALEAQLVEELRGEGFSWADIGGLLGITGESARRHFKDRDDGRVT